MPMNKKFTIITLDLFYKLVYISCSSTIYYIVKPISFQKSFSLWTSVSTAAKHNDMFSKLEFRKIELVEFELVELEIET